VADRVVLASSGKKKHDEHVEHVLDLFRAVCGARRHPARPAVGMTPSRRCWSSRAIRARMGRCCPWWWFA